jgi:hypothetical protein
MSLGNVHLNLHAIERISVEAKTSGKTEWMHFVFTDRNGVECEVDAFVRHPIAIEGGEFVNFVAAHQEEPA